MLSTFLSLLMVAAYQGGASLPPGVNAQYREAAVKVEDLLAAGKFSAAREAARLLPSRKVRIVWDDSALPDKLRLGVAKERDRAFGMWAEVAEPVLSDAGDIKFTLTEARPRELTFTWSDSASEPRLSMAVPVSDVAGRVHLALRGYLGISDLPVRFPASSGAPGEEDRSFARRALDTAVELRRDAEEERRRKVARPRLVVEPRAFDLGKRIGGDSVPVFLKLRNAGPGTLEVNYRSVEGALFQRGQGVKIAPRSEKTLEFQIPIDNGEGEDRSRLQIDSNDPLHPRVEVPLRVERLSRAELTLGEGLYVKLPPTGKTFYGYLLLPEGSTVAPERAYVERLQGTVKMERWSGVIGIPERKLPKTLRQGYRFTISLDGKMAPYDEDSGSLVVETRDRVLGKLEHSFKVQRGITMLPDKLGFGEVGLRPRFGGPTRSPGLRVVIPSRSGRITRVSCDWSYVKLILSENSRWAGEYWIRPEYLGGAPEGVVQKTVTIETDLADQPVIRVPLVGRVRWASDKERTPEIWRDGRPLRVRLGKA